jgi:hypothetical protein
VLLVFPRRQSWQSVRRICSVAVSPSNHWQSEFANITEENEVVYHRDLATFVSPLFAAFSYVFSIAREPSSSVISLRCIVIVIRHMTAMIARRKAGTGKYTRVFSRHFHPCWSSYSFAIIRLHFARLKSREKSRNLVGNRQLWKFVVNSLERLSIAYWGLWSVAWRGVSVGRYYFLNAWVIIDGSHVMVNRALECKYTDVDARSIGNGSKFSHIYARFLRDFLCFDISAIFLYSPRVRVGSN